MPQSVAHAVVQGQRPGGTGNVIPEISAPMDMSVEIHGTPVLLTAQTTKGRQWIAHNVDPNATRVSNAIAVERRLINDLVRGAPQDGLVVR